MACEHEWYIVSSTKAIEQLYGTAWDNDRVCRKCNCVEFAYRSDHCTEWIKSRYTPVSVLRTELQRRFKGRGEK